MNCNRVTVTGADDAVDPNELVKLSVKYPFAEWGILVSKNSTGTARFPGRTWQSRFAAMARDAEMKVALHLCGEWLRELAKGAPTFFVQDIPVLAVADRIQLNFHGEPHECISENFVSALANIDKFFGRQFTWIFQIEGVNDHLFELVRSRGTSNVAALFDLSHGAGKLPEKWPAIKKDVYCGYAGGLTPQNVIDQLSRISGQKGASGGRYYWIDAETGIRDGNKFDLALADLFFANSRGYIVEEARPTV